MFLNLKSGPGKVDGAKPSLGNKENWALHPSWTRSVRKNKIKPKGIMNKAVLVRLKKSKERDIYDPRNIVVIPKEKETSQGLWMIAVKLVPSMANTNSLSLSSLNPTSCFFFFKSGPHRDGISKDVSYWMPRQGLIYMFSVSRRPLAGIPRAGV